jgi:hypothetical protein
MSSDFTRGQTPRGTNYLWAVSEIDPQAFQRNNKLTQGKRQVREDGEVRYSLGEEPNRAHDTKFSVRIESLNVTFWNLMGSSYPHIRGLLNQTGA